MTIHVAIGLNPTARLDAMGTHKAGKVTVPYGGHACQSTNSVFNVENPAVLGCLLACQMALFAGLPSSVTGVDSQLTFDES